MRRAVLMLACAGLWCLAGPARAAGRMVETPIKHVIIIMQENRSFDSYFGTYPGANGLPAGVCVPLVQGRPQLGCVAPFHDPHDSGAGGPHAEKDAQRDLDNGINRALLDGFVASQANGLRNPVCLKHPNDPHCIVSGIGLKQHDVMGYHDASDIPNYWAYAQNFVLQDAMFEGVRTWSWPSHLELTSEWAAVCSNPKLATSCVTSTNLKGPKRGDEIPWVSLFQLLDLHKISWKYYLGTGKEPDCDDGAMTCAPPDLDVKVPSIWNPAPFFSYVKAQPVSYLSKHVPELAQFLKDVQAGRLPRVSWIVPGQNYSEHPPAGITAGMEYVTSLVNAVMQSPYWADTAIFITWDDWGGFYDHVVPPIVDYNDTKAPIQGYGLRVPGLMISAYARQGYVDHAIYSVDSYARFIEDQFMEGARLDPVALGNPDTRHVLRDRISLVRLYGGGLAQVGSLVSEFDFSKPPRPPMLLSTAIPNGIAASCANDGNYVCTLPAVTIDWNPAPAQQTGATLSYGVQRDGVELPQCAGTATRCVDTPGSGAHLYRAYSLDPSNGVKSPLSAAAEADEP